MSVIRRKTYYFRQEDIHPIYSKLNNSQCALAHNSKIKILNS